MSIKDKKVLVIEDVADQAYLARRILENVGLSVSLADSVDAAVELLQIESPHVILLDLQMPGKPGFKFLEYRRTVPAITAIPVIVASGLQDQSSVLRAITLGADDYLLKPYHAAKLLQKVRKALKDTVFQSLDFAPDLQPAVLMSVAGEVTQIGRTGFTIETAAKIAPRTRIELEGKLDFLPDQGAMFVSGDRPSVKAVSGRYATRVNAVGIAKTLEPPRKKR